MVRSNSLASSDIRLLESGRGSDLPVQLLPAPGESSAKLVEQVSKAEARSLPNRRDLDRRAARARRSVVRSANGRRVDVRNRSSVQGTSLQSRGSRVSWSPTTSTEGWYDYNDWGDIGVYGTGITYASCPVPAMTASPNNPNNEGPDHKDMRRPWIGITTSDSSIWAYEEYFEAVYAAGGMPVQIKPGDPAKMMGLVDGLLLTGGRDISPSIYEEKAESHTQPASATLDNMELRSIAEARLRGLPIMGVCRGHQLLNAALGGKLKQHLDGHGFSDHKVQLRKNSTLRNILGGSGYGVVNSRHHQAVISPGKGLRIVARAADSTVEACESAPDAKFWMLTTQFHPEALGPYGLYIFKAFIEKATARKRLYTRSQRRVMNVESARLVTRLDKKIYSSSYRSAKTPVSVSSPSIKQLDGQRPGESLQAYIDRQWPKTETTTPKLVADWNNEIITTRKASNLEMTKHMTMLAIRQDYWEGEGFTEDEAKAAVQMEDAGMSLSEIEDVLIEIRKDAKKHGGTVSDIIDGDFSLIGVE